MGRKRIYEVVKHLPAEELDIRIRKFEKDTRVLKRLYFIRHLYRGMSVEEAAELVGVTRLQAIHGLKGGTPKATKT